MAAISNYSVTNNLAGLPIYNDNSYYITASGTNGTGSYANPFTSWSSARSALQAGDTLFVMPGTYNLTNDLGFDNNGTANAWITVKAFDTANIPVIKAPPTERLMTLGGKHYFLFQDLEFDGDWVEDQLVIIRDLCSNITFRNIVAHEASADCFIVSRTDNLIFDNCDIFHCIVAGVVGDPVDAHAILYNSGNKLTVLNSRLHHTSGDCIQVGTQLAFPQWDSVIVKNTELYTGSYPYSINGVTANTTLNENAFDTKTPDSIDIDTTMPQYRGYVWIENVTAHGFDRSNSFAAFNLKFTIDATLKNVITYNSSVAYRLRGNYVYAGRPIVGAYVKMIDCLAYDNYNAVLWPEEGIERLQIYNCTFDPGTGDIFEGRTEFVASGFDFKNNILIDWGSEGYINDSDPSLYFATAADFLDMANHNYHLVSSSAARNTGVTISEVKDDYDGLPRIPDQFTPGAYEYYANPYYVSASGTGNGSSQAQAASYASLQSNINTLGGRNIFLEKDKTYTGGLTITADNINLTSYGVGNNPVITGLTPLTSWTAYGSNIYYATVPGGPAQVRFLQLNGVNTFKGREPDGESNWYTIKTLVDDNTIIDTDRNEATGHWDDATFVSQEYSDGYAVWSIYKSEIAAFNTNGTFDFSINREYGLGVGMGYFLTDGINTLDTHGEWCYREDHGRVYIYLTASPSNYNISVSATDRLIYANAADNIVINGIDLHSANLNGAYGYHSSNFQVYNGRFDNFYEAVVATGSNGTQISYNIIDNSTGNGVVVYNCDNSAINNNHLTNIASHYTTADDVPYGDNLKGIKIDGEYIAVDDRYRYSDSVIIQGNYIDNVGYSGIHCAKGNKLYLLNNYITDACQLKHDGGAIYFGVKTQLPMATSLRRLTIVA
ncbi:MAG: right-handed parallel beta-helix repeat-containing protein [Bacteroidales bacterium]|nr:right-handed parallel beta-helix repeat-containing protein [Bacteroidales bacterium]